MEWVVSAVLVVLALLILRPKTTVADAHGVRGVFGGRRRRVAWADVRSVLESADGWEVSTRHGLLHLDRRMSGATELGAAIQAMLLARGVGWALPRAEPPPQTALSRLGSEPEANGQRGLTVSAAPGDES
jgi:hypothetical protein